MARKAGGVQPDRGSVAPAAAVLSLVMVVMLALAVDLAVAYGVSVRSASNVAIAEEEAVAGGSGFALKNSDDPGRDIAIQIMKSIRSQGSAAAVTVWFWEAPAGYFGSGGALPAGRRLMVVGVEAVEEYEPVSARAFGAGPWSVAAGGTFSIAPYSEDEAWRPDSPGSGVYALNAGADPSAAAYEARESLAAFPSAVREEAENQMAAL